MPTQLTETDKLLLLGALGAPDTVNRVVALLNEAGTGNMSGPALSTDKALPRFNGITGAVVQNSGVILSDLNGLSGISTLAMAGALSGVTSLAMAGILSGVTNITMSGTISGPTSIASGPIVVTGSAGSLSQIAVTVANSNNTGTANLIAQGDTGAVTFQVNQSGYSITTGDLGPNQGVLFSQAGLSNGLWFGSLNSGVNSKVTFVVGGTADANRVLRLRAAVIEPLQNIIPVVNNTVSFGSTSFNLKDGFFGTGVAIGQGGGSYNANSLLFVRKSTPGANVDALVRQLSNTGWSSFTADADAGSAVMQMQGSAAGFGGTTVEANSAQLYTSGTNGMGLYSLGAGAGSKIHFSVGGIATSNQIMSLTSTNVNINKLALKMNSSATAASTSIIFNGANDGSLLVAGGAGNGDPNAVIQLFGSTEATHAKETRFFNNSILSGVIDANAVWTIGESGTTNSQAINTGTAAPAADALTFLNGPTGTAGNPDIYMKLNINGTVYAFPGFAV